MIRPVNFGFNAETAVNNAFQVPGQDVEAQQRAQEEFDGFVHTLHNNGVDVIVVPDTPQPHTPDSIFPNNWISFHTDGTVCLYPMFAVNRRQERKPHVLDKLQERFIVERTYDLTHFEQQERFLEGTGSMVLDRDLKIAYACLSPRTDKGILEEWCRAMDYQPLVFDAVDGKGQAIYHTNVVMCVADRYVVVCMDALPQAAERELIRNTIDQSGKELIEITLEQLNRFAGNMLQIASIQGETLLVMSSQAYHSLTPEQVNRLRSYNRIIHAPLSTIETNGGGSARCMIAEVFLERRIAE
ncbi:citrulline utilization hydrolase CtlX [Paraflavitalea speifideaquila]|uniref:citrulline utilization hydrolase CtlX n=1 Tax=Paraflavitalea speifideaquila TaxID=3076558 RepID=UPI0028E473B0|nr:arginine deiminase-related protein [Paraflavitalea speifideiaquila]